MTEKKEKNSNFKEVFCGANGHLSSKRVLGAIVLLACLCIVIAAAFKEGITDNIESLIEILIITATALLGITSITSIWKQNGKTTTQETEVG